jgi:hypothetical protein
MCCEWWIREDAAAVVDRRGIPCLWLNRGTEDNRRVLAVEIEVAAAVTVVL